MQSLGQLLLEIEIEARRGGLDIDRETYKRADKPSETPILYAGDLNASVAFLGRDLGKDEVLYGEPLIGGAGRKVRLGVCKHFMEEQFGVDRDSLRTALKHILLTNMVPYKPVGNRAFPRSVRERFRPHIARFLVFHWHGNCIITLGAEAFHWFAPYTVDEQIEAFWSREDRFEAVIGCAIRAEYDGECYRKAVSVMPLPHPSPLNRKYMSVFPDLLAQRLAAVDAARMP